MKHLEMLKNATKTAHSLSKRSFDCAVAKGSGRMRLHDKAQAQMVADWGLLQVIVFSIHNYNLSPVYIVFSI